MGLIYSLHGAVGSPILPSALLLTGSFNMVKNWKGIVIVAAAMMTVTFAFALGIAICPIDNTKMSWTGNTREEGGKKLAEYTCVQGHTTWIVVN